MTAKEIQVNGRVNVAGIFDGNSKMGCPIDLTLLIA